MTIPKVCKFFQLFALHLCSNLMVAMAAERALNVYRPTRALEKSSSGFWSSTVNILVVIAWTASVFFSLPQLIVWETLELSSDWEQCTTVFQVQQYMDSLRNVSQPIGEGYWTVDKIYNMSHLVTVFWLPALLITVAYGSVFHKLLSIRQQKLNLRLRRLTSPRRRRRQKSPTGEEPPEEGLLLKNTSDSKPPEEGLLENVAEIELQQNTFGKDAASGPSLTVLCQQQEKKPSLQENNWRRQMRINRLFNKTLLVRWERIVE